MTVLIDPPIWVAHGRRWSHLVSDTSFEELHVFARSMGIPERGFEGDHYDVPEERYRQLVLAGAHQVNSRELLTRLQAAGLRRRKRRGEKVLASHPAPDGGRIDTMLSRLDPLATVRSHLVMAVRGRPVSDQVLVVQGTSGPELPSAATPPASGVQLGYLRHLDASLDVTQLVDVVWQVETDGSPDVDGADPVWIPRVDAVQQLPAPVVPLLALLGRRPEGAPR